MSTSHRSSVKSYSPSRPSRLRRLLPMVVLLVISTLASYGCGTPVIKVDTSPCNRKELTERGKDLPLLESPSVRAAVKNHIEVTREYAELRNRHNGLVDCVEENSR